MKKTPSNRKAGTRLAEARGYPALVRITAAAYWMQSMDKTGLYEGRKILRVRKPWIQPFKQGWVKMLTLELAQDNADLSDRVRGGKR